MHKTLSTLLLATLLGLPAMADEKPLSPSAQAPTESSNAATFHLTDAAFEKYIDVSLIAGAVQTLDAALLTDLTLQLAEGERVLGRAHKAGSAATLAPIALKAAVQAGDTRSLARLGKYAYRANNAELKSAIASATKLAGTSRKQDTPEEFEKIKKEHDRNVLARYIEFRRRIKVAKLIGNQSALLQLRKFINAEPDTLPAVLRDRVIEELDEAIRGGGKLGSGSRSESSGRLGKLLSASRGNEHVPSFGATFSKGSYGVAIVSLDAGSPLKNRGFNVRDIISSINGTAPTSVADLNQYHTNLVKTVVYWKYDNAKQMYQNTQVTLNNVVLKRDPHAPAFTKQVNTGPHQTLKAIFANHSKGARVVQFEFGSELVRKGMKQGDVIYEIDDDIVNSASDLDGYGGHCVIKYYEGGGMTQKTVTIKVGDWRQANSGGGGNGINNPTPPTPTFKNASIWIDNGSGLKWWGPYDRATMTTVINQGWIKSTTPISLDGGTSWDLCRDVPHIFSMLP